MSAVVIILPVVPILRFGDPDFEEQHLREVQQKILLRKVAPPRSRPMLVNLEKYRES